MAAKDYTLDEILKVQFIMLLKEQFGSFESDYWSPVIASRSKANIKKLIKSVSLAVIHLPVNFLLSNERSRISFVNFSASDFIGAMRTFYRGSKKDHIAKMLTPILAGESGYNFKLDEADSLYLSDQPNPYKEFINSWSMQVQYMGGSVASLAVLHSDVHEGKIEPYGFYNLEPTQERAHINRKLWETLDFVLPDTAAAQPHVYSKVVFRMANKVTASVLSSSAKVRQWAHEEYGLKDFSQLKIVAEEYRQRLKDEGNKVITNKAIRSLIDDELAAINPAHERAKVGKRVKSPTLRA